VAASPAPVGSALPREAVDPEVAAAGALAALYLHRVDDYQRFLEVLGDHPRRRMIEGWRAVVENDEAEAIAAFSEALVAVDDDAARSQCVSFLARLGEWPTDVASDMKSRGVLNDEMFEILQATSTVRSEPEVGLQRLRTMATVSHLGAMALIQCLQMRGLHDDAISECERQMERWSDTSLPTMCADLLRQHGREEEAKTLIDSLLSRVGLSDDLRLSFMRWLVHFYGSRGSWRDLEEVAVDALAIDPSDAAVGWNYLISLSNQRKFPEARSALASLMLVPAEYDEVRLWVQLHYGEPWSEEDVKIALDVAETGIEPQLAVLLVSLAAREMKMGERTFGPQTVEAIERAELMVGVDPRVVRPYGTD
jgi:hypothetical protein